MRKALNDEQIDQVVGGTVRFSGSQMKAQFTVLGSTYNVQNCSDTDAMSLIVDLYAQYKTQGNRAFETATLNAMKEKGWITED